MTAEIPAALADSNVALVVGNSMYPRYSDGDIITYIWHDDEIALLYGKECVIELKNGKTYVKTLTPGSNYGFFHLISFNAPTILDAEIERIARITWIERAP